MFPARPHLTPVHIARMLERLLEFATLGELGATAREAPPAAWPPRREGITARPTLTLVGPTESTPALGRSDATAVGPRAASPPPRSARALALVRPATAAARRRHETDRSPAVVLPFDRGRRRRGDRARVAARRRALAPAQIHGSPGGAGAAA